MDPRELDRIATEHGVLLLVQFGSTVSGSARRDSDIDLAVLLKRSISTTTC